MIPKEILKKVRQIEIRTGRLVNDVFAGEYESVFKGRGMEFHEVREYVPGDDIRSIDWNVTARSGHPYVKKFVEERELTVIIMADMSGSGNFGTRNKMKTELMAEIGAVLSFSAVKNNDKVGLLLFTDKVEKFIPPKKGRPHVLRVIRELLYYKPESSKTSIGSAVEYLGKVLKKRAVVFLISDFMDTGYEKLLGILNKRHDIVGISISDPREKDMPDIGLVKFEDAETGEILYLDTSDDLLRKELAKKRSDLLNARNRAFRSIGVDSINISTDKPYIDPLIIFFRMRAKRFR
ncbi:MAG: DUF58 domain-containing protein [Candidatus Omnitrophica bacterium CG22_combo_CG10-13_8_21_14_all_43_16]|nr:MAG: DUF58 domain-containing protein [Candidatus Omnitrophica bacterium CG22_combo_CG10-13_8_21_14_all_43_16]